MIHLLFRLLWLVLVIKGNAFHLCFELANPDQANLLFETSSIVVNAKFSFPYTPPMIQCMKGVPQNDKHVPF